MDKYHIYEEIGKGEFSQVFKGREKKKIEYVAIKRVDKSIMKLVVNEVQIMHKFECANVVRFYDWYETRNNLWLIVEYCTGGNLSSLLKQDGHLPEESVRMFGLDLLSGLKYLHQFGVLHCDLQLKNILIDEYGILKISDFKAARRVPKEGCCTPSETALSSSSSSLAYTAPELITNPELFSFASEFWALGCILYQLRRGFLPFGDSSVSKDMLWMIQETEPLHHPKVPNHPVSDKVKAMPSISFKLSDLLSWMLEKSPADRLSWNDICRHPFWGPEAIEAPKSLPVQPLFESHISNLRTDLEAGVEREEFDCAPTMAPVADSAVSKVSVNTKSEVPLATRDEGRKKKESTHAKEEDQQSGASSPAKSDRAIHEKPPDLHSLLHHPSDLLIRPIVDNKAIEIIDKPVVKSSSLPYTTVASGEDISRMSQQQQEAYLTSLYKHLLRTTVTSSSSNGRTSATPSLASQLADRASILTHLLSLASTVEVANIVLNTHFLPLLLKVCRAHQGATSFNQTGSASKTPLSSTGSRTSQTITMTRVLAVTALAIMLRSATYIQPPAPSTPSKASKSSSSRSSSRNSTRGAVTAPTPVDEADSLLGTLMGILRETSPTLSTGAAAGTKTNLLSPLEIKLRRRAVAALGELVFYISSQEEVSGDSLEPRWLLPSITVTSLIRCLCEEGEVDVPTVHYVSKAVENILAQGAVDISFKFLLPGVAVKLLELSCSPLSPALQATATSAFSQFLHLVVGRHPASSEESLRGTRLLVSVIDSKRTSGDMSTMLEIIPAAEPRQQQAILTILNTLFSSLSDRSFQDYNDSPADVLLKPIRRRLTNHSSASLPQTLLRIIEQSSSTVLRAKALICAQLVRSFAPLQ